MSCVKGIPNWLDVTDCVLTGQIQGVPIAVSIEGLWLEVHDLRGYTIPHSLHHRCTIIALATTIVQAEVETQKYITNNVDLPHLLQGCHGDQSSPREAQDHDVPNANK